jgi:hypothetical protein
MPALDGLQWGRLGMLAAGIVVVVLVLLLVTKACGGSSATSKNEAFFTQVKAVLVKSDQAGSSLHDLLRSQQPVTRKAAVTKLTAIKAEAQQAVSDATKLKPTKQVEPLQPYLLQALSYRVNGIDCMIRRLTGAYRAKPASAGGAMLVPCTQILLASDVIYINSYYAPAGKALQDAGVEVQVPTSPFLSGSDSSLLTAAGMGAVLQRWKPGSVAHGLHGLVLDTVVARDSAGKTTTLHAGTVNKVKASGLTFLITATNGGNFTEFNIPVKLTIGSGKNKLVKTATINQIAKGAQETVSITGFGSGTPLPFGAAVKMTVLVTPVPGERTASNNSQTFQITFSL